MKKISLSIIFFLSVLIGFSQQQNSLLNKYRDMALEYNHDLKAAEKNIKASIEFENMARADMKPKLTGGASAQYTGNPMELNINLPSSNAPLYFQGNNMNYGAAVSLLQPIYTGGKLLESIQIAKHQQSLASAGAEIIGSAICFQTDIQYWNTVARYEMTDIAANYYNSIASLVNTIKERVDEGLSNPQDLLMAEVKLNEAEYQRLQAESSFETGRMALNSIIGVDLKNETPIDVTVPLVILNDSLLRLDGNNRAELKAAQCKIKIAESALKLNDAKYKPQFYVGADGNYSSPGYNFHSDLNPNYAVYAKLSIPILEWGKRRSEKKMNTQKVDIETLNMNTVEDNINLEIQTSRLALIQAIRRTNLALSSLDKARENERQAVERYNEGEVSIVEVIDAQTYRHTSQVNYTLGKVAAQQHYSELLKAINSYDYQQN